MATIGEQVLLGSSPSLAQQANKSMSNILDTLRHHACYVVVPLTHLYYALITYRVRC